MLASIIDRASDAIFLLDFDLRVIYRNMTADALLKSGLAPDDLFGCIHPEDRAMVHLAVAKVRLFAGSRDSLEARFVYADGRQGWMAISMFVLPETDGMASAGIVIRMLDIEIRKRLDQGMKEAEERWNSALVSSGLGVWDHNLVTGNFYYSDTWRALRGMEPDEGVAADPADWLESVHPDDRDFVREQIDKQNAGVLDVVRYEYRERHRDGHWIWIECRGACIERDEDGRPTRIVGTDTDVTARKEAEEQLKSVSERLQLALDISQIGVFEADLATGINLWDDRLLAIYGITGEDRRQKSDRWMEFLHPDDRETARTRVAEGVRNETTITNQFRIINPDGRVRHIKAKLAPIHENGKLVRFIGANWDVTDDVAMREALVKARNEAEQKNRELEIAKARIEHDALHDFLTGLANRRFLDETLAGFMRLDPAERPGIAVMHLDLDRFKEINDSLGHHAGDEVLIRTARILSQEVTAEDFVARVGGDEFVILKPFDGDIGQLAALARRIIRAISEPFDIAGQICHVGTSIGIAHDTGNGTAIDQLVLNADVALYRAKERGRNRHEFFSAEVQQRIVEARKVSDGILSGLEKREFIPYYQLQFDARSLNVTGAETLARWRRPKNGIVAPRGFIAVAEDIDAMTEIDALLLEQALADLARWQADGVAVPKLSVNISARRLKDDSFAARLASLPFRPGTLSFELVETIFLDDCDAVEQTNLEAIRKAGIGIELDDFGTGHASLLGLLNVNPDTIKIARELIRPVTQSRQQRNLVGAIIEIGKGRGIRVIAEGVETAEQARLLADLGCDALQGFALASPMPFDLVGPFIAAGSWR